MVKVVLFSNPPSITIKWMSYEVVLEQILPTLDEVKVTIVDKFCQPYILDTDYRGKIK